ncbi:caspase family protein [Treponema sp. R80B11-R83G3]
MSKALVVGIDDYPSFPLQGCVKDAKAVAELLARNTDGSPNFDVKLEISPSLNKGKLKAIISAFFEAEDAVSLFYFAGHGFLNEYGGYIVTPDYANYDEGISMSEILAIVNNSKSLDKIVILDCCHSGDMGRKPDISPDTVHIGKGVTILTSSGPHEAAAEVNGHGVFTNLLLAAMDGGAADLRGKITPGSIYSYIDLAMGSFGQRPSFKSNITKFVPLRTVEPPIPQVTLRKLTEYFITPEMEFPLDPSYEYTTKEAIPAHVAIFQDLQKCERVELVVPLGEQFMYYAAINSKSCKLTALGKHYWLLVKRQKI